MRKERRPNTLLVAGNGCIVGSTLGDKSLEELRRHAMKPHRSPLACRFCAGQVRSLLDTIDVLREELQSGAASRSGMRSDGVPRHADGSIKWPAQLWPSQPRFELRTGDELPAVPATEPRSFREEMQARIRKSYVRLGQFLDLNNGPRISDEVALLVRRVTALHGPRVLEALATSIQQSERRVMGFCVMCVGPDPKRAVPGNDICLVHIAEVEHVREDLEDEAARESAFTPATVDEPYAFRSASGDPWVQPLPIIAICPQCHGQHVDRDEWATPQKAHKTHLCEHCGNEFRVAMVPTVGVEKLDSLPEGVE